MTGGRISCVIELNTVNCDFGIKPISTALLVLNSGRIRPVGPEGLSRGIDKRPLDGPVQVTRTGLANDEPA